MRDVTKTKPSHYRTSNEVQTAPKPQAPVTFEGTKLAAEVEASGLPPDVKARLVREIMDYEATHGSCTKTFQRKVRKVVRPKAS
jgi:hypothetical protein